MSTIYEASESYTIVGESGTEWHLYGDQCLALLEAKTAKQAEHIYDALSIDIPLTDRCSVWLSL